MKLNTTQLNTLRRMPLGKAPNRVQAAMDLLQLTQVQVAEMVGSVQPKVSQIVNGKYSRLPIETARDYAEAFGCQIEDLFPAREAVAS